MDTAVLLLNCDDQPGIVYHVAQFIYDHGGNIIDAQQHTEELDHRFFMRVHFQCAGMDLTRSQIEAGLQELADRFQMQIALSFGDQRKRVAILVSRYDHCLYDLLLRHQYGELKIDIPCVVSNHAALEQVARQFKVPYFYIPIEPGRREEAEEQQLKLFRQHYVDCLVLARYMQVLPPLLVEAFRHRIINVHHGFLPAFKGAKPYHQAYERGVKLIGATSHYVTEELDMGPIIAQETAPVRHTHSVAQLIAMGRDIEKSVLATAVQAHAEDRIMVYRQRTIVFQ